MPTDLHSSTSGLDHACIATTHLPRGALAHAQAAPIRLVLPTTITPATTPDVMYYVTANGVGSEFVRNRPHPKTDPRTVAVPFSSIFEENPARILLCVVVGLLLKHGFGSPLLFCVLPVRIPTFHPIARMKARTNAKKLPQDANCCGRKRIQANDIVLLLGVIRYGGLCTSAVPCWVQCLFRSMPLSFMTISSVSSKSAQ